MHPARRQGLGAGSGARAGHFARDFMRSPRHWLKPEQRVFEAAKLLVGKRLCGLPVLDEQRRLVGVLTEKDCVRALSRAIVERLPPSLVRDVMSPQPMTVGPDDHLMTLAHYFTTCPIGQVPVVDRDGHLLGMISRRELLKEAMTIFEKAPSREAAVLYLSATGARFRL